MPTKSTRDFRLAKINSAFDKDRTNLLLKNSLNRTMQSNGLMDNQEYLSNLWKGSTPSDDVMNDPTVDPTTSMGFTPGDYVGMASSAVGAFSQMANTIANAKATKPVVNHYEGFNEKAIANNRLIKDELGYSQANAKAEMERQTQTSINTNRSRVRGSSSSMNTMRAMDLAVDISANEAKTSGKAQMESGFSQQLMQAMGVDTQLLSQQDQMEMAGRTQADDANAQNLDSFYTNFAQNIASVTNSGQKMGADINQAKYRNDVLKLIPGSNKWGVGVDANMDTYSTYTNKTKDKYTPKTLGITEQVVPNFDPLDMSEAMGWKIPKTDFNSYIR